MTYVQPIAESENTILYRIQDSKYIVHFSKQSKSVTLMCDKGFRIIAEHADLTNLQAMLEVLTLHGEQHD